MDPSTLPKSISFPQIRSKLFCGDKSSRSVEADYAEAGENSRINNNEVELGTAGTTNGSCVQISGPLSPAVCRICHGGELSCPFGGVGSLIAPCNCSGSMGRYHRECLEKWLSMSNKNACEICKFPYSIQRCPRPWTDFIRNPGDRSIRRNILGDLLCLCILTPTALASCWLCIAGALAVAETTNDVIAVPGLASLAIFLMLTYIVWLVVSIRYHVHAWRDWRHSHQMIRLMSKDSAGRYSHLVEERDDNNNAAGNDMVHLDLLSAVPSGRSSNTNASQLEIPGRGRDRRDGGSVSSGGGQVYEYPNTVFMWESIV